MVENLRNEKASHDEGIERLTLRELREKVRRKLLFGWMNLNEIFLLHRIGSVMCHACAAKKSSSSKLSTRSHGRAPATPTHTSWNRPLWSLKSWIRGRRLASSNLNAPTPSFSPVSLHTEKYKRNSSFFTVKPNHKTYHENMFKYPKLNLLQWILYGMYKTLEFLGARRGGNSSPESVF